MREGPLADLFRSTGADAPVFPNSRGGRVTRQRVGKILHDRHFLRKHGKDAYYGQPRSEG